MFPEVKKKLGFGCMRLPTVDGQIDEKLFCEMIDTFMDMGFNYFDTSHGYMNGQSQVALKNCLVDRYPRESYILTTKLPVRFFNSQEDVSRVFTEQLKLCGVDYFDFYLMHSQDRYRYPKFKACRAYETALALKQEGKIRHFGISFHDKPDILETILSENPQIEFVQIQFNYLDYEDNTIESKGCYDICRKFNKPIIVMEPVKGGNLVDLPEDAQAIFDRLNGGSNASYAIRFAASFPGIFMVLSGMSNLEMIRDNCSYMQDFKPLSGEEMSAVFQVRDILVNQNSIPCTGCNYCTEVCPKGIAIPKLIACMNTKTRFKASNAGYYYRVYTELGSKASDCIACGKCEAACPQHLNVRKLLKDIANAFEN